MKISSATFDPYSLSWGDEVKFPSTRNLQEYGNRIFNRYPARSIFMVPRAILAKRYKAKLNVLDPFMGSGTTAVEAIISENKAFGVEVDPFARLVSDVSSQVFSKEQIQVIEEEYKLICEHWRDFQAGNIPNLTGIERWFKDEDLGQLLQLRSAIESISSRHYRKFFIVTFADCIKPVSLIERQSLKPYISSKYTKQTKEVQDSFMASFKSHIEAMKDMSDLELSDSGISWVGNDATNFTTNGIKMDIAIASPPYINALDYTRCIKIESALCGTLDNTIASYLREHQVGHDNRRQQVIYDEVKVCFQSFFELISRKDWKKAQICLSYFNDVYKNLCCIYDVLKSNGEYHIIIGDNTIKGISIPTHSIILHLSEIVGFRCFGYYYYAIRDHRTSLPRNNSINKIKIEHVLMLRKI